MLTSDLHCKKDGLKIGAHGIGLDLNRYDIIGPGRPGTKGIENPGYDNVVITGYSAGTIRGFDHGIELRKGADDNEIVGFYFGGVHGVHYGLVMYDSDSARVDDNFITAGAAKDGYDGGFGAAFALYRSHDDHFEENYSSGNGVNMVVLDNSHRNNIGGNIFARNAKDGIFIDRKSTDNVVGGNLAVDNGKLGINVQGTVKEGSKNRAFGNGWSAQCRGINCAGQ